MKRTLSILAILLMGCTLLFSACAGTVKQSEQTAVEQKMPEAPQQLDTAPEEEPEPEEDETMMKAY